MTVTTGFVMFNGPPSSIVLPPSTPLPPPRVPITIRAARADDLPFIDSLQKIHQKQVGFMPKGQLLEKIAAGQCLIAEEGSRHTPCAVASGAIADGTRSVPATLGYIIGQDRYFKHDDVGIIYQINVAPGNQRGFIGAALLRAMFDRAAYGCRLFCCWCAQDIEANRFWESMGFVPLAFRAGSEKKARVHIFWQKRIRAGDQSTPWWFPAKTDAGALREDRLVLPIPPGTHWSAEMPRILPAGSLSTAGAPALEDQRSARKGQRGTAVPSTLGPVKHGPRQFGPPPTATAIAQIAQIAVEQPKPQKKPKRKADPKLVSAARELRDRWLEQVNAPAAGETAMLSSGKYDVSRQFQVRVVGQRRLLPAA